MSVAIHKNYSNSCCQNPANSALEDDHEHDEHRPRFLANSRYPLVFPFRSFSMLLGQFRGCPRFALAFGRLFKLQFFAERKSCLPLA